MVGGWAIGSRTLRCRFTRPTCSTKQHNTTHLRWHTPCHSHGPLLTNRVGSHLQCVGPPHDCCPCVHHHTGPHRMETYSFRGLHDGSGGTQRHDAQWVLEIPADPTHSRRSLPFPCVHGVALARPHPVRRPVVAASTTASRTASERRPLNSRYFA